MYLIINMLMKGVFEHFYTERTCLFAIEVYFEEYVGYFCTHIPECTS